MTAPASSNIAASLATALALQGRWVAVVNTEIQSSGIHILFGLGRGPDEPRAQRLWGRCSIEAAAHDVLADALREAGAWVLLVPSSIKEQPTLGSVGN